MSKTTNKQQLSILISLMEANPGIARGFYKGSKEELARFWEKSETELNSAGPPITSTAEWKKVWADQKKYVQQKAAQNLKIKNGTGGDPNTEQKFSPTEEAIYNLIAMKDTVEGLEVRTFGLGSHPQAEQTPELPEEYLFDLVEEEFECQTEQQVLQTEVPSTSKPKAVARKPAAFKESASKASVLLEAELEVQKELLENIKIAVLELKEQHQSSKKIYRSLDKIGEQQKNHFKEMEKLKREELNERLRHNNFMERLRAQEVEYKLEKIRRELND